MLGVAHPGLLRMAFLAERSDRAAEKLGAYQRRAFDRPPVGLVAGNARQVPVSCGVPPGVK